MFAYRKSNFFRKFKIRKFQKEIEPQEVFLDSLAQEKEKELGISEKKFEVPVSQKKSIAVYAIFLVIMLIFFAKTFDLQILRGDELSVRAQDNKSRIYQITPTRGVIYDSNLKQLVRNKISFDLVLDKRDFSGYKPEIIKILEQAREIISDINPDDLCEEIEQSKSAIVFIDTFWLSKRVAKACRK